MRKIKNIYLPLNTILKKAVNLFLLVFFSFGTLCFPMGDFAVLKSLPEMFQHCKATEDKDLTVFEFLFEHVSGIGQLVEGLEHVFEDEEGDKPHSPIHFHFEQQQIICAYYTVKAPAIKHAQTAVLSNVLDSRVYVSDYISIIFRPPIIA